MVDPKLREQLLALPEGERQELIAVLQTSIADEDDLDEATLRLLEESRRDADAGLNSATPWHDVRADLVSRGLWPTE